MACFIGTVRRFLKVLPKVSRRTEHSKSKAVITGETPSASSFEDLNLSLKLLMGLSAEMVQLEDSNSKVVTTGETPCTSSTSALESKVDALKIDVNKNINKLLDEPEDSNIKAVTVGETPYTSATSFEDLKLSPELLNGIYVGMGFQKPSKTQAISLPMILTRPYKDLIAQAAMGSGITTCGVLAMLSRVDPNLKAPQALCICPTRELAMQIMEVVQKMGKHTGITIECAVPVDSSQFTNYIPINKRAPLLAHIVVGTPATIKRWYLAKKLALNNVKMLVFDEADRILAQVGFKDDSLRMKKYIEQSSHHCQVLLFSAIFNETVKNFVAKIVKDYNQLFVKKEELSLASVKQYKVFCPDENTKIQIIKQKIFDLGENLGQRIIFVRTKDSASKLHRQLVDDGYTVTSVQGAINPEDRDKIVKEFRDGLTHVLITNDNVARGFDQEVNLVINYVLPVKCDSGEPDYDIYLHRIGAAFNLICGYRDEEIMKKIEVYFESEAKEVKNDEGSFEVALKEAGLR